MNNTLSLQGIYIGIFLVLIVLHLLAHMRILFIAQGIIYAVLFNCISVSSFSGELSYLGNKIILKYYIFLFIFQKLTCKLLSDTVKCGELWKRCHPAVEVNIFS